jgi:hypothetical protein
MRATMQLLMDERKEIDRARRKSKGEEGGEVSEGEEEASAFS